jgi:hypothetical protein
MHHRLSLLVVAAFLAASCDVNDAGPNNFTKPTTPLNASAVSVSTTSPTAAAHPVGSAFCPSIAPFNVPLVIVVQPIGVIPVVVTAIRLQFFDTSGFGMPMVTLPAPVPTAQFGTGLNIARSAQFFPVTLGIGCGTGISGRVQVIVETRDDQGRTGSGNTTVRVN